MNTMTAEVAQAELRRRIRKYFVTVVLGLVAVFVVPMIFAVVMKLAGVEDKTSGAIIGIFAALAMFGVVGTSWFLVFKWWRCPACDRNIYWLVSMNMSAFAGTYGKRNCPQCDIELFPAKSSRRFVIVIVAIAIAFGALGAAMSMGAAKQRNKSGPSTTHALVDAGAEP